MNLEELRKLAEAVDDDGWYNAPFLGMFIDDDDDRVFPDADAVFIAAADPATVLRLLDVVEAARRLTEDEFEDGYGAAGKHLLDALDRLDER